MIQHYRANVICNMIRKSPTGTVTMVINDEPMAVGFCGRDGGKPAHAYITMLGGGYYNVYATDGRKFPVAKGQLMAVEI